MPQIALAVVKERDVQQLESDIGLVSLTTNMLLTCDLNIAEMHYHTKILSYYVKVLECLGAFFTVTLTMTKWSQCSNLAKIYKIYCNTKMKSLCLGIQKVVLKI